MDTLNKKKTVSPLQRVSYAEKIANKKEWFKQNADELISRADLGRNTGDTPSRKQTIARMYEMYNSRFPGEYFSHILNPLNSSNENHKRFPAKIRPINILRTNLDQFIGEFIRRPFVYEVANMGGQGFNSYMEGLNAAMADNFMRKFQAVFAGEDGEQVPLPEVVEKAFRMNFRDKLAVKGAKKLKQFVSEMNVKREMVRMFKDWVIAGEAYSFKGFAGKVKKYKRISPLAISYDMSTDETFVEKGRWVVVEHRMSLTEIADHFWPQLKESDYTDLEWKSHYCSPTHYYSYLHSVIGKDDIPVYHVQWAGFKKIGIRMYTDELTGEQMEDEVDDGYIAADDEKVDWIWKKELYETWRISDKTYVGMDACVNQEVFSYNGRKFSDTHSENVSLFQLGIPIQVMSMIITYKLELTVAKSKDKVLMVDINSIPKDPGWSDEKFFYYSDALGYMMVNRNQVGVDRSFNQFQVLDMSLYEKIAQLITLQQQLKQDWDDLIGMSRQRKGEQHSSDLAGPSYQALQQSTVITETIFHFFEELVEADLQGILDITRIADILDQDDYSWLMDDMDVELANLDPIEYSAAKLKLFVKFAGEEVRKRQEFEGLSQAMLQNKVRPSAILEMKMSENTSEMLNTLKVMEAKEDEIIQQQAKSEQEAQMAMEELQKERMAYEYLLKTEFMQAEYDEKKEIELTKGAFNTFTFQDGDANDNGVLDALEVQKLMLKREELSQRSTQAREANAQAMAIHKDNVKLKERDLKIKARKKTTTK